MYVLCTLLQCSKFGYKFVYVKDNPTELTERIVAGWCASISNVTWQISPDLQKCLAPTPIPTP